VRHGRGGEEPREVQRRDRLHVPRSGLQCAGYPRGLLGRRVHERETLLPRQIIRRGKGADLKSWRDPAKAADSACTLVHEATHGKDDACLSSCKTEQNATVAEKACMAAYISTYRKPGTRKYVGALACETMKGTLRWIALHNSFQKCRCEKDRCNRPRNCQEYRSRCYREADRSSVARENCDVFYNTYCVRR
jgi:hypothetical protein